MFLDLRTVPSFVINLDRYPEKYDRFRTGFSSVGIFPQRMSGVDAKFIDFTDPSWNNRIDASVHWTIRNGRYVDSQFQSYGGLGCYLSHTELWRRLLSQSEHEVYIIYEDDCEAPTAVQLDQIHQFLNETALMYPQWDLMFMGFVLVPHMTEHEQVGAGRFRVTSQLFGLHAYVIHKRGAAKLLQRAFPIVHQLDSYITYECARDVVNAYRPAVSILNQKNLEGSSIQTDDAIKCDLNRLSSEELRSWQRLSVLSTFSLIVNVVLILLLVLLIAWIYFYQRHRERS